MSLSPHNKDKNRKEVLRSISDLEKEDTAQAADKLKEQHNMGDKQKVEIVPATAVVAKK